MTKTLVIVESPTKARTIEKFLGKDFVVKASYGHVRDLPNNASEIPENIKKEKWSRLGVNVDSQFEPLYIIPPQKKKHVKELKDSLKGVKEILLATDEDREGESISWHLLEVLKPKIPVKRLVFHEITKKAIAAALQSPRDVDENLVKAQETRRIVDRLFGYTLSPLLWKKMAPKLSAGRVQSVATRLLVDRERERMAFKRSLYWDLKALFSKQGQNDVSQRFEAELSHVGEKRIASGKDFEPTTGQLIDPSKVVHLDEKGARALLSRIQNETPIVQTVESKPFTSKPPPPFATSTLQQEASRKLNFAARRTMQVAQTLYENGLITYMRTDSISLSEEAVQGARTIIANEFGAEYLSAEPRIYKTKVKNAQEAHEAIRPAGADFAHPSTVKDKFGIEAFKLYELIWKRTLASQMKDSVGTRVSVAIQCGEATFRANGQTIQFAGYIRAYVEGSDDPEAEIADRERILPPLSEKEKLSTHSLEPLSHETLPPARYTEGSLIKELERRGIGRPSTWATIVDLVLSRAYAFKKGSALVPTFLALALTTMMERFFAALMDYEFTARLEDDLDSISRGEADNLKYLHGFYFGNGHSGLTELVASGEKTIDPREVCGIQIGTDPKGTMIEVRIGRYGPFITNGEARASVPDMLAPDELTIEEACRILREASKSAEPLGKDPVAGLPVYLKNGRFGPYIQLGEQGEGEEKPRMVSLLPGMQTSDVTLEVALKLLQFPKNIGKHPETGDDVIVATGRFGPYVKCAAETRSLPSNGVSPLDLTLEQAVALLKEPKKRGRGAQPQTLKEVGKHPASGATIALKQGRYGPYVTDGTINASLGRGMNPDALTIDEAVSLLDARAAKISSGEIVPKKKAPRKTKKVKKEEE